MSDRCSVDPAVFDSAGIHAFDAFPLEIANRANARIRKFISEMTIE